MPDLAPALQKRRRYDSIRLIGEEAGGKLYPATDRVIRRPVAIKTCSLDALTGPEDSPGRTMREFFLETRTAGALLRPNIVVIYDVGKKGRSLCGFDSGAAIEVCPRCREICSALGVSRSSDEGP